MTVRTIYNGPYNEQPCDSLLLRADELAIDDYIFSTEKRRVVYGVVDRISVPVTDRPVVRLRLHEEIDGVFAGEATFDACDVFRVRRIKNTNNGGTS
jgi:hypothetical protein